MKIELSVSLLALDYKKNLNKFLKIMNEEKIKYLELPITKIFDNFNFNAKKLKLFRHLLKKHSLKISSIQSIFFGKEDLNIFDKNKHQKIILHVNKVLKISKYLGAKNLIFGSPINRRIDLKKKQKQGKIGIQILKKIITLCKNNNMILCIEPNAKYYKCNYINSVSQAIKLVNTINSRHFLINADTGNISLENKRLVNLKKKKNLFGNFQVSEKNLICLTKGRINHKKILNQFDLSKKIISLEMKNININKIRSEIKKFKNIMNEIT